MTPMCLTELEFGSLLTYTPRGTSDRAINARDFMLALKQEGFVGDPATGKTELMSKWVAKKMRQKIQELPFGHFFQNNTVLVPIPKSSLMQKGSLWVPERIASALSEVGLGERVQKLITRFRPVPKAATSLPENRPWPRDHYNSLRVVETLKEPDEILLVDDVVTRGATLIGAANRLIEAFPETTIRAFAVMRTISNSTQFEQLNDPCIGNITLRSFGDTIRRP